MQITYSFDSYELRRQRHIQVTPPPRSPRYARYAIPQDTLYDPVQAFFQQCKLTGGFPFRLLPLLHETAIKKLGRPTSIQRFRGRSLLISGGLYLALNLRHPDLEIREQLGDFAAGFSHEFGVGCTVLVASALFDIPPDALNPIAVDRRKIESYLPTRYHTHTVLAPPFCSTIKTINEQYISECTIVQTYVLLYYCCYGGFYVRQCECATNILPAVY